MRRSSLPRLVAVGLALGGTGWGVFLLLVFGANALWPLPFGFGYAVTAGYWLRALTTPELFARRAIWAASIAVQGTWLALGLMSLWGGEPNWFAAWWALATAASVVALRLEPPAAEEVLPDARA